jgi:toxin HigB-1
LRERNLLKIREWSAAMRGIRFSLLVMTMLLLAGSLYYYANQSEIEQVAQDTAGKGEALATEISDPQTDEESGLRETIKTETVQLSTTQAGHAGPSMPHTGEIANLSNVAVHEHYTTLKVPLKPPLHTISTLSLQSHSHFTTSALSAGQDQKSWNSVFKRSVLVKLSDRGIINFGSKETEKIWVGERVPKLPLEVQNIGRRKLRMLNNSQNIMDLRIPPSNRLEKLSGKLKDFYSIRINDQWRIVFKWSKGNASDVRILDYHR